MGPPVRIAPEFDTGRHDLPVQEANRAEAEHVVLGEPVGPFVDRSVHLVAAVDRRADVVVEKIGDRPHQRVGGLGEELSVPTVFPLPYDWQDGEHRVGGHAAIFTSLRPSGGGGSSVGCERTFELDAPAARGHVCCDFRRNPSVDHTPSGRVFGVVSDSLDIRIHQIDVVRREGSVIGILGIVVHPHVPEPLHVVGTIPGPPMTRSLARPIVFATSCGGTH